MEPVVSTVLQALAAGAQAAATGIATDEIKRAYKKLKTLIQQKWIGKPTAEKLLTAYENNPKWAHPMVGGHPRGLARIEEDTKKGCPTGHPQQ
jgi:hypothetical protein